MSAYRCEACGTDAPLSEPCPVCEPLVTRALDGDYDLRPIYMPLPCGETRALLARIDAMRVDRAVLVEQLAQKNREIQTLGSRVDESRNWAEALEVRIESWRKRYGDLEREANQLKAKVGCLP